MESTPTNLEEHGKLAFRNSHEAWVAYCQRVIELTGRFTPESQCEAKDDATTKQILGEYSRLRKAENVGKHSGRSAVSSAVRTGW